MWYGWSDRGVFLLYDGVGSSGGWRSASSRTLLWPRPTMQTKNSSIQYCRENDMAEANRINYLHMALLMMGIVAQTGTLAAQEVKHLNPVIEKLAAGKPFIGFQTGDLTLGNARTMARAD